MYNMYKYNITYTNQQQSTFFVPLRKPEKASAPRGGDHPARWRDPPPSRRHDGPEDLMMY